MARARVPNLTPAEIATLEVIAPHTRVPLDYVIEELHNLTEDETAQVLQSLEKKDLLERGRDEDETYWSLTLAGKRAWQDLYNVGGTGLRSELK